MALRYLNAKRILIRCPNWIGDAVAATAAIRCVRTNYPQAYITLWFRPYVHGVYENAPWHQESLEAGASGEGLRRSFAAGLRLRRMERFDLALLLTHSFSSAVAARLAGARWRVGHARNGRSWLLTDAVPWPGTGPEPDRIGKVKVYRSLLEYMGCSGAEDERPEVFTSAADESKLDDLFAVYRRDASRPLLALVPGAAFGSSKLWDPPRFAAVADQLARRRRMQPMILTGPGESAIGAQIAREMKESPVLFGEGELPFGALKAAIRRSVLMICNDTGPRHIAIAFNVPTVVVMGPTDPRVTESNYDRAIILQQDVPCGPCYLRSCPTDHRCMRLITADMVLGAAEELLERFPPKRA